MTSDETVKKTADDMTLKEKAITTPDSEAEHNASLAIGDEEDELFMKGLEKRIKAEIVTKGLWGKMYLKRMQQEEKTPEPRTMNYYKPYIKALEKIEQESQKQT